ncbi:2'-5' RNA ligase [Streptoalloteichus tenebrarius]|uniref:RNA 2',3'-cyclic phosphodiesterase n=1 Tax=Streptoalloteichus tenebrarius (strain ATCC 17920 / DSM 40477 / JCM 4838 / CBS 697.72 / NBRC 16177 / NCIMB 11028 / NRRL B-12390 / A12253. 1 / ISP 5477) TaxID=1933 RepID=A0ABT1HN17_STRSD|nr:RNA 2',3'-cyclic phosphodiesterase [Streptoalloteichus tenebrarius]MCP2256908.1 2'-5' RNA ligase [Streptoalloteichus tenebrarius]BFF00184.1 RNA 2',3'-cyclic phosphodiesterase [Streptoalloteichus tenebrarius]
MRLFTAVWPPESAVEDLASALRPVMADPPEGLRWTPPDRWHLTLCFHGESDEAARDKQVDRLRRRAPKAQAPTVRFAGSGVFRGVLWVGVEPRDERDAWLLSGLAKVAGCNPHGFRAHLTVARWWGARPDLLAARDLLSSYAGPWWSPREVLLVRSDLGRSGSTYTPLARVPLAGQEPTDG